MEAEIVAQAGRPGVITIATNMAGRGTDIVLGGNVENQIKIIDADPRSPTTTSVARAKKLHDEWQGLHDAVKAQGGLRIIATERHGVAPHRQPAAWPLGPPGRPGLFALLPVARRFADAHLRRRPRARDHGAA